MYLLTVIWYIHAQNVFLQLLNLCVESLKRVQELHNDLKLYHCEAHERNVIFRTRPIAECKELETTNEEEKAKMVIYGPKQRCYLFHSKNLMFIEAARMNEGSAMKQESAQMPCWRSSTDTYAITRYTYKKLGSIVHKEVKYKRPAHEWLIWNIHDVLGTIPRFANSKNEAEQLEYLILHLEAIGRARRMND